MNFLSKLTNFHIFALPFSVVGCLLCLSGVSVGGNCLFLVVECQVRTSSSRPSVKDKFEKVLSMEE